MDRELDPMIAYDDDPVTDVVHHPYSAFNQGYDAAEAGIGEWANPYGETREGRFWSDGWHEWNEQQGGEGE